MEVGVMGMRSAVAIRASVRDGVSYLASSYFTPPFKVANITEDKSGPLQLMLMCSSPGVLDGDRQVIEVELEAGARVWLQTQSYQRLFQMKKGAVQTMEVRLGAGASFCWLPHPCVPHADSIFTGRNKVYLASGARLIWGEVLTCGRKLNGEMFALGAYHMRTEVYVDGQLVLLENLYLKPAVLPVEAMGQLEGYTHQASLLWVGGGENVGVGGSSGASGVVGGSGAAAARLAVDVGSAAAARMMVEEVLSGCEGIIYGVSEGPAGSMVVRMLGGKAEQLYNCLKEIACKLN